MSHDMQGITALGIKRPVFIVVVNLLIMLAGIAGMMAVDVRELPDIDRPIISVRAVYDGASPETMDAEITSVVEGAVSRVAGVKDIESSSEENNMRMRVEFDASVDINSAASDVREAVSRIQRELPDAIDQLLIYKADDDAQSIIEVSAYSDTLTPYQLAERIEKEVLPELQSIMGVAEVRLEGEQPRVLRVMLQPDKLMAYGLSASDVLDVLRTINLDVPAGSYRSTDMELLVRAQASVTEPALVEQMFITDEVRLGDVAQVMFDGEEAESYSMLNGRMVIGLGVVRQAGSNTITIAQEVDRRLATINERTKDYTLAKISDDSIYIKGALKDVVWSLVLAVLIVLVVIALFLGQWRAMLIPAVTMPVALVGTVAVIWLLNYSVNLLTLLALVLSAGLIVDDAIIVLENIQRRRAQGLPKLAAALVGTQQVFFAVIATTITLVAVFLPITFLPGDTGALFTEFGVVLSAAVIISSFVAVTLCPMMASRLPNLSKQNKTILAIRERLEQVGNACSTRYFNSLHYLLKHRRVSLIIAMLIAVAGAGGFTLLSQELLPAEDRGEIHLLTTGPDGASLMYADGQAQVVEEALRAYQQDGVIEDIYTTVGQWDKNRSYTIATLKPWESRSRTQQEIVENIEAELSDMPGALFYVRERNSLDIRGAGEGVQIALLGSDYATIYNAANKLSGQLQAESELVDSVRIDFDLSQPELSFDIDRERANDLGVPISRIADTLRVMVDRLELLDLNVGDQAVPVMVEATEGSINSPADLLNIHVASNSGALVTLSALVTIKEQGVAAELDRYEQQRGISLTIKPVDSSKKEAIVAMIQRLADDTLNSGVSLIFMGETERLNENTNAAYLTFSLSLAIVFLVLAAQFESFGSALIVMFTVPFGLAAAVFALLISGQTLNLYSQIGLVMLVGLMTKNAILLVEFMDQLRDEGRDVMAAIDEAVRIRLRPVVMTVVSTVLGALPLILSSGPGAEARNAIGWVVFGGLGLSTLFTLYLAPLGYALIAPYVSRRNQPGELLSSQLNNHDTI